jgi:hypothetical protein
MFSRKKCNSCGEAMGGKANYCPHCGRLLEGKNLLEESNQFKREQDEEQNFGMLGKNDSIFDRNSDVKLPLGFNLMFKSLVKAFDAQFKELDREMKNQGNSGRKTNLSNPKNVGGISINISSFGNNPPRIKVRTSDNLGNLGGGNPKARAKGKKVALPIFNEKNLEKLSKLPRVEPEANVKRFSDKVIYEIDMPGVKSPNDVLLNQLENSIEIKAVGKSHAYSKILPINLPIRNYKLQDGKLILELETED